MIPEHRFGRKVRRSSPRNTWSILLLSCISLIAIPDAWAQEPDTTARALETQNRSSAENSSVRRFRFGGALGLGLTDFSSLDVYRTGSDCGSFGGSARRPIGRIFLESPLDSLGRVWLSSSLRYNDLSAVLESGTTAFEARRPDGTSVDVLQQYRFDLGMIGIGAGIGPVWEFLPSYRVGIIPSVTWLVNSRQSRTEHIVEPLGWSFSETGENARPVEGKIAINPIQFDLNFTAGARLPLGPRMSLQPELEIGLPLTSIARDLSWNGIGYRLMVGIAFDVVTPVKRPDSLPAVVAAVPIDTPVVAGIPDVPSRRAHLSASITAMGVDAHGEEYADPVIEIEEAPWTESMPIIPYIFFDSGSVEIPARYTRFSSTEGADRFSIDSVIGIDAIGLHRQQLNIIGQRLRERPNVTATITGTVSSDEPADRGDELGLGRAEAVRSYLATIWGIEKERISTLFAPRATPPSNEETVAGREENRRVELSFSDESVVKPVVIHRVARVATPPAVQFRPDIVADTTVVGWTITVRQGEKELLRFDSESDEGAFDQSKLWSLADLRVNRDYTPIGYHLEVRDITGQTATAHGMFKVTEQVTTLPSESGRRLSVTEFNLVGFNFNSAEILLRHYSQLPTIVEAIEEESQVQIEGFTDHLGDSERNVALSLERATGVRDALTGLIRRLNVTEPSSIDARGYGDRAEPFDNMLPEGRMLSRMVRVTVSRQLTR